MKQLTALSLILVLFAGAVTADTIQYISGEGDNRRFDILNNVTVTAWSAQGLSYTREGERTTRTIPFDRVITVERQRGSMSDRLATAIATIGSNPTDAMRELANIAQIGNDLDKEEAGFWRLQILLDRAAGGGEGLAAAITEHQAYLRAYRAGYFARDVYQNLHRLQVRARRPDDARATLRQMIDAEASMARQGNQWLGEFEADLGRWGEAVAAFRAAKTAAQRDGHKAAEYFAQAWEGRSLLRSGDATTARPLLDAILNDEDFQDPFSEYDDRALAIAFPSMGDLHFAANNFERAYDAFIKGAYYAWWIGGAGEGYCLAQAFLCARQLEGTDARWQGRRERLRRVLVQNFPRELQRVED